MIALRSPTALGPAYDLRRTGPDAYRLQLLVPGFAETDLELEVSGRQLVVRGRVPERPAGETVLHAGIVRRAFERRFDLAPHVEVTAAKVQNGILTVELARQVPETLQPRRIAIAA